MLPSFIQRNVHGRNTDILSTKTFFKYFLLRINDKNRLFFHRAHLSASCNLERLRYNGKHSAKPFVRAAAEWAGAEHLPNPIKIGKRNRYESTHKSGQNAGCQVQLHQPDPAHCNRPGGRFGAGFDLPRCCMDRRIRQPVCRRAERRCTGAGVCYCCQCTGAGLLQAGPPLWYGGLAVHAHHLCGGCAQRCDQQAVPADAGSGGSCHGGCGAPGPG